MQHTIYTILRPERSDRETDPFAFVSRDIVMLLRAYTTYVRPLLEFNMIVWSPLLKCDISSVEKVQRKFTKRLPGYGDLSYVERRAKLNLKTSELRRLRYDLVMCYKIVFNIIQLRFSDFFVFSTLPMHSWSSI